MDEMEVESELLHLENKMRSLLSELVTPIMEKLNTHTEILEKLQKHDRKHKNRHKTLDTFVQRTIVRLVPIEEFNKKIYDFFSESRNLESSTSKRLEYFASSLNQLTHHVEYLKVSYKTMEEVQKNNEFYFKVNERLVREAKELLKKQMTVLENTIKKNMYETAHVLEKIVGKVDNMAYHFSELNDKTMPSLRFFVNNLKEKSEVLSEKVEKMFKERVTIKDIKDFKLKIDTDASNMRNKINSDLKIINTYFDKSLKYDISTGVLEIILDFSSLEQLESIDSIINKSMNEINELVKESKDMKSENYQMPAQTLSQLIHQRRVFEKQMKVLEERKIELERIEIARIKNINEIISSQTVGSNSNTKLMAEPASLNRKNEERTRKNEERFRKKEVSVESDKHVRDLNRGIAERIEHNEKSPYRNSQHVPESSSDLGKTSPSPIQLSIGGKTQITVLKSPRNIVQSVQNLKITPTALKNSRAFNLESGLNLEKQKLRNSFLVLTNEKSIKSKSPGPERQVREKQKFEKSEKKGNAKKFKSQFYPVPDEKESVSSLESANPELIKQTGFSPNEEIAMVSPVTPTINSLASTAKKTIFVSNEPVSVSGYLEPNIKPLIPELKDSVSDTIIDSRDSIHEAQNPTPSPKNPQKISKLPIQAVQKLPSLSSSENPSTSKENSSKMTEIKEESSYPYSPSFSSARKPSAKEDSEQYDSKRQDLYRLQDEMTRIAESKTDNLKKTQNEIMSFTSEFVEKEVENLKNIKEESIKKIKKSAEKVKKMLINDQEELRLNIKLIYDENRQLIKQRVNDMQKIENELKTITGTQLEILNTFNYTKEELNSLKNFQEGLLESTKILFYLLKQDEKDRENLQLTAYSEHRSKSLTKHKPQVTLRPECLSCSGQASSVYSAFKMACLNYTPSEIIFNNKHFPRTSLIKLLGEYISHIKEYPYYTPTITESKASGRDESFLKLNSKTPKIPGRYLLNNSSSRISELESSIIRKNKN